MYLRLNSNVKFSNRYDGDCGILFDSTFSTKSTIYEPYKLVVFLSEYDCPTCVVIALNQCKLLSMKTEWRNSILVNVLHSDNSQKYIKSIKTRFRFSVDILEFKINNGFNRMISKIKTPCICKFNDSNELEEIIQVFPWNYENVYSFFENLNH